MKKFCALMSVALLCACSGLSHQAKISKDGTDAPKESGKPAAGQSMFDFSSSFQNSGSGPSAVRWNQSASEAISQSKRTGLPLLILFTQQMSQPGVELETLLNVVPELNNAEAPSCVPLRVDFANQDTARSDYYRSLKTRYKLNGFPVLLMTLPDGTEVARQTGYNSEWKTRTTQLVRYATEQSKKRTEARRKEMGKFGYRMWSDRQGTQVWARLDNVDATQAVFVSEWGEPFRTFISRLSDADQARLAKKGLY